MKSGNSFATTSGPSGAASAVAPRYAFIVGGVECYHWKKLETLIQNG